MTELLLFLKGKHEQSQGVLWFIIKNLNQKVNL